MKRVVNCLITVCVCVSVCSGAFDHVVSETYEGGGIILQSESILVSGAGVYIIEARGTSYVEVQGTAPLQEFVGGIGMVLLDGDSSMNYYGGETLSLRTYDNSLAVLEGGRIDYIRSFQYTLQPDDEILRHIEIVCDLESVFHDTQTNVLTGNWLDGSGFEIQLVDQAGYDPVIENILFTPEPATLLLVGAGGLLLRRKRR